MTVILSRTSPLDCSRAPAALLWSAIGAAFALVALLVQGAPNAASLLRVGMTNPMLPAIEQELGPVFPQGPTGHDGQLYYLVARDPLPSADTIRALATFDNNTPRYRYRRILFPLLAGGFGQFSGRVTLWMMIALTIVGMALTSLAIADLAFQFGLTGPAPMVATFNLGAFLSVMLLTADILALGLSLGGAALFVRGRHGVAVVVLALAALAKETYVLVPIALSAMHWRRLAVALSMLSAAIPLACWTLWLAFAVPDVSSQTANLGLPLSGMISVADWWRGGNLDAVQAIFGVFIFGSVILASLMLLVGRCSILRWILAPWLALAAAAGVAVWSIPTNAARAFAILWPLGILLLQHRMRTSNELP